MAFPRSPRLAIIGCGTIVEYATVPALRRLGWLPSVLVDISPKRCDVIGRKLGWSGRKVLKTDDWRSLADEFDAAIVAVPHALHGTIGTALAAAGKHVFMEKPLAVTGEQCRAMISAADRAGVTLSAGLIRRNLRSGIWLKALLDSGVIGEIRRVSAREGMAFDHDTSSDALLRPELSGGGVLIDTGAHALDSLLWWCGNLELVQYRDDADGGVEADCTIQFKLASGGTCHVELSRTRNLRNSVQIEGAQGFVEIHSYKNEILSGSPNIFDFKHDGMSPCEFRPQFTADLFDCELADFKACVSGDHRAGVSGRDGMMSVELIERCYAARQPLSLPWVAGAPPIDRKRTSSAALSPESKALVTGASGFVGGRLVERLIREHGTQVRCVGRNVGRMSRAARLPIYFSRADIADPEAIDRAVQGVDYVFHCAYDPRSRRRNIDGLRNLVAACTKHSVKRLLHVSTFAVYEPFPDGPLTEKTRDGDRSTVYIDTKLELEGIVLEAAARGLPATIIQPSIVYGPFCRPWTNTPAEMLICGEVVLPDRGDGLCNALYIDDLTDALMLAAVAPGADGERFLISGPDPVTWAEFFTEFSRALGVRPPVYREREHITGANGGILSGTRLAFSDPRRIIKHIVRWNPAREVLQAALDAMPGPLRQRIMNYYFTSNERRGGETFLPDARTIALYSSKAVVDFERARSILGYRPRFDFQSGMALTAAYLAWAYGDLNRSVASEHSLPEGENRLGTQGVGLSLLP